MSLSNSCHRVSDVQDVIQPKERAPDPHEEAHRGPAPRLPPLRVRSLSEGKLENTHPPCKWKSKDDLSGNCDEMKRKLHKFIQPFDL